MMRKAVLATAAAAVLAAGLVAPRAFAEEPRAEYYQPTDTPAPVDPRLVIREKAQQRAKARAERIAARNWLGLHPSRPRALATPLVGPGAIDGGYAYPASRPTRFFYRYR